MDDKRILFRSAGGEKILHGVSQLADADQSSPHCPAGAVPNDQVSGSMSRCREQGGAAARVAASLSTARVFSQSIE